VRVVVEAATAGDAAAILRLRLAAEDWLYSRGIEQWGRNEVTAADVSRQIDRGEWHVVRDAGATIAAFRLLWSDPHMWGELDTFAAYVHGLMIDRSRAGTGLGAEVLSWVEERARSAGAPAVRLDCVESNKRLRDYYREQGFTEVGRRDFDGRWSSVVLMENDLRLPPNPIDPSSSSPA
jgi:GNAT superfamily N-acetyltransferase